jgi:hypothetical protein
MRHAIYVGGAVLTPCLGTASWGGDKGHPAKAPGEKKGESGQPAVALLRAYTYPKAKRVGNAHDRETSAQHQELARTARAEVASGKSTTPDDADKVIDWYKQRFTSKLPPPHPR